MTARRVLVALLLASATAQALTGPERELLRRSLRPAELESVTKALGGLDSLPLKALDVELFPEQRRISGHARLEWTNHTGKPLVTVFIRLSANGGTDAAPKVWWKDVVVAVDGAPPVPVSLEEHSTTLRRVKLPKPLAPGKRLALQGMLDGRLASVSARQTDPVASSMNALKNHAAPGASSAQYGTFACGVGICTLTGFAPEVPAFIDGSFDLDEGSGIGDPTYSEPSNVMLSVVVPAAAKVAATGLEVGRVPEAGERRRWTFVMAGAREVGFVASSRFVVDEATVNGVRVRSYSLDSHRKQGRRALDAATGALAAFDKAFGRYPWAELTLAESALVGGAGGVELPGLALGATGFYADPASDAAMGGLAAFADMAKGLQSDMLDFIIRHEVAHQWWHAQVGSHAQRHPWLDEPLAQWSALYATRMTEGKKAADRARQLQVALNFQAYLMMGGHDGPVARAAGEFDDQIQYAALVYGKAPLFYSAFAKSVGEKKLLSTLRSYVRTHRFQRAEPGKLRELLVAAAGKRGARIDALWKRWFQQAHGLEDIGTLNPMALFALLGGMDPSALGTPPPTAAPGMTPAQAFELLNDLMKDLQ